ncbi:DUF4232 domain-containing protein [Streptomyces sp. DK15]|uniref:DUF4232 domain-containing protein n=1 Tax=Streptomyces sp. DK15 TaxID=2957499 RepID=UPI0029C060BA|nr:DUF4232 domain-containing protein [Streptomyces sp. DK15]
MLPRAPTAPSFAARPRPRQPSHPSRSPSGWREDSFPAGRRRPPVRCGPTVLKKGTAVSFGVNYPLDTTGGSGVRVTGLVVTPPDETKSVTLTWPGAATLPVTDGTGSPIKVGPIGSAGQGG